MTNNILFYAQFCANVLNFKITYLSKNNTYYKVVSFTDDHLAFITVPAARKNLQKSVNESAQNLNVIVTSGYA